MMDSTRWGWRCVLQLQEADNWEKPAATTWAAEVLLREDESREFLGSWINSNNIHAAKRRRSTQVITGSFPCERWLHMIGARASLRCKFCRREGKREQESMKILPEEMVTTFKTQGVQRKEKATLGHIINAGSASYVPSPKWGVWARGRSHSSWYKFNNR